MVIGKSGGGTGGGQVVGKKVAPVKQPLLRSKQATSKTQLSLYSLCLLSTTILNLCQPPGHSLKITTLQHQIEGGRGHMVGC